MQQTDLLNSCSTAEINDALMCEYSYNAETNSLAVALQKLLMLWCVKLSRNASCNTQTNSLAVALQKLMMLWCVNTSYNAQTNSFAAALQKLCSAEINDTLMCETVMQHKLQHTDCLTCYSTVEINDALMCETVMQYKLQHTD